MSHIAILDIGKTNKKCFVFDEDYRIAFEKSTQLPETADEDGYPCEDLVLLRHWVLDAVREVLDDPRFQIQAINCTAYGASLVHLDAAGNPIAPLYNYLKPFPEALKRQFFEQYGGEEKIALETASPVLGNLNAGMQLYWLKHHKPLVFRQIKWSLHLPQYIAANVGVGANVGEVLNPSDVMTAEMTSIGCHTMLWDFQQNDYHEWVKAESLVEKFPPIRPSNTALQILPSSNPQILESSNPRILESSNPQILKSSIWALACTTVPPR